MQDGQSCRDLMTTTANRRIMKGCRMAVKPRSLANNCQYTKNEVMQDGQSCRDLMTTTDNRRIMKGCRTASHAAI
uniref:Uncharacterized protein n=1 Tax=Pristionchus pacificus TaxID=54126 RepID=A0A2A6CIX2_PRIPA|eukprot:PDM78152.1 hypothetical protein PRIPAC_33942 [Pristionchus pacificus]